MRRVLKRLAPVLCLGFSACGMLPGLGGGGAPADPSTVAPNPLTPTVTTTVNAAAAVATAAGTPTPDNIVNAANAVATAVSTATASGPPTSGTQNTTFDSTKSLEYADVYVDMGDPTGMQALVPYLMKPKDWMLIGCEMTSATSKHYRFMKVASNTGQELPDVNIFKGR